MDKQRNMVPSRELLSLLKSYYASFMVSDYLFHDYLHPKDNYSERSKHLSFGVGNHRMV